jgi:enoyl-CoA hydratase/carnithine racemase
LDRDQPSRRDATCASPRRARRLLSDELHAAADALAEKLSWGAPLAKRAIKRVVNKALTMDPASTEESGRLFWDELWRTEDHREGVNSHVEKRKPVFKEG